MIRVKLTLLTQQTLPHGFYHVAAAIKSFFLLNLQVLHSLARHLYLECNHAHHVTG